MGPFSESFIDCVNIAVDWIWTKAALLLETTALPQCFKSNESSSYDKIDTTKIN